ncbi:hypothetical protein ACSBR1_041613 [Camellia fascicularis]
MNVGCQKRGAGVALEGELVQTQNSARGIGHMDVRREVQKNNKCRLQESTDLQVVNTIVTLDSTNVCEKEVNDSYYKPYPLEILDHVKINNTLESPISTIKGVMKDSKEKDLSFNKEELRKVEERLKLEFIEFYQKLCLLKNYRRLLAKGSGIEYPDRIRVHAAGPEQIGGVVLRVEEAILVATSVETQGLALSEGLELIDLGSNQAAPSVQANNFKFWWRQALILNL